MKKKIQKLKISDTETPKTIYGELQPTLILVRIFGFAPFKVSDSRAVPQKKYFLLNLVAAFAIAYHTVTDAIGREYDISKSDLAVLLYSVINVSRNVYMVLCLLKGILYLRQRMKIWTILEDINFTMKSAYIETHYHKNRLHNFLLTISFLLFFLIYVLLCTLPLDLHYSITILFLAFLSQFYSYLIIYTFCVFMITLKRKCQYMNEALKEELKTYKKKGKLKTENWFLREWDKKESIRLLYRLRTMKKIHMKMYGAVKHLNSVFGIHFVYFFFKYFAAGWMHCFTILRYFTNGTNYTTFILSIYTLMTESIQIVMTVYGATVLDKEVLSTTLLVHKFLMVTDRDNVDLENELQAFSIQLHQCQLIYTAAGLFLVHFTMLLQFAVAFVSNAVFFFQIDIIDPRTSS